MLLKLVAARYYACCLSHKNEKRLFCCKIVTTISTFFHLCERSELLIFSQISNLRILILLKSRKNRQIEGRSSLLFSRQKSTRFARDFYEMCDAGDFSSFKWLSLFFHTENPSSSTTGDKCNPSYFYFCLRSHGEKKSRP